MACGCNEEQGQVNQVLLGSIEQQMPGVDQGAPFQFGANFPLFGSCSHDIASFAGWIESAGLSYNTVSYKVAGSFVNPFWTIEGNAKNAWASGTDFGNAIYNAIVSRGCDVDVGSIQFRTAPPAGGGQAPAPGWVGTPYPVGGGSGGSIFDQFGASLGLSGQWTMPILIGGGILLVVLLTRR